MKIENIIFNKWTDLIGGGGFIISGIIILIRNLILPGHQLWANLLAYLLIILGILWKQKVWCEKIAIYWGLK